MSRARGQWQIFLCVIVLDSLTVEIYGIFCSAHACQSLSSWIPNCWQCEIWLRVAIHHYQWLIAKMIYSSKYAFKLWMKVHNDEALFCMGQGRTFPLNLWLDTWANRHQGHGICICCQLNFRNDIKIPDKKLMLLFFKLLYAQVIYSDSGTSFYWSILGTKPFAVVVVC